MKQRPPIDRKDLYSGLATLAIGLFALIESIRMPRLAHLDINPYTVPGLVPGMIGAVLAILGAMLTLRAVAGIRRHSPGSPTEQTGGLRLTDSGRRVILTLLATIIYARLLFGQMPFTIATTLFVFAFTLGAEYLNRNRPRSMVRTAIGAAVLALVVAFTVEYVFEEIFRVRLTR